MWYNILDIFVTHFTEVFTMLGNWQLANQSANNLEAPFGVVGLRDIWAKSYS